MTHTRPKASICPDYPPMQTLITKQGQRVTLEEVPCNFCGAADFEVLYKKHDTRFDLLDHEFRVGRCRRCELAYLNPRPTADSIGVFYPQQYFEQRYGPKSQRRYYEELALLPEKRGHLLDVGCANGDFANLARQAGYAAEGLEVAGEAQNPHGLPMHGSWEAIPDTSFGIVTAWAVFEHLHHPGEYFRQVARVLRPGGHFLFLVPNFDSPVCRRMKSEDVPRHLYFYTPATARRYLETAGLRAERIVMDTEIYSKGQRGYLQYLALRAIGREFRQDHRTNPKWAYRAGRIPLWEYLYLQPVNRLDRRLERWITAYYCKRDQHGSMIVFAGKPS